MTEETVGHLAAENRERPNTVRRGEPISRAIEALIARPKGRSVYVVDDAGKLLGVVSFRDLLRVTNARYGASTSGWLTKLREVMRENVEDVMRPATPAYAELALREALATLQDTKQNDLPIIDAEGRLVGELNALQVLDLALRVFRQTEADVAKARSDPV